MRWIVLFLAVVGAMATMGAGCDTTTTANPEDLAPPLGLMSVTGNGTVTLRWLASNYGEGRQGFLVYQAAGDQSTQTAPDVIPAAFGDSAARTVEIADDAGSYSTVITGLVNGNTYSFLVVAYKDDGSKISRPSNVIRDTPRFETPTTITLVNGGGNNRYLDLNAMPITPTSAFSSAVDILCQSFDAGAESRHGMVGQNGVQIMDLGFVSTWDEIDKAPLGSTASYPAAIHSVEVIQGHVYAVWTGSADNHYAKVWVTSLHPSSQDFGYECRVAYQPQQGSNELDARADVE